jgi:UDP-N-acetylmuramoylalanine--D-glutamate ligase
MIPLPSASGSKIAVLGLGHSGLAAARALITSGAQVLTWDDDGDKRQAAAAAEVPIADLNEADLTGIETLVLSPGIPHTHPKPHPVAAKARRRGIEIIGDIELMARAETGARFIGVTGTNGKSTVTALIGHIFTAAGKKAAIGGNFGPPVLALDPLGASGTYVLELSSYQLELIVSDMFDIAVLINISPDHIDRHGTMDGYVAAKRRVFDRGHANAIAVIGVDDGYCREIRARLEARDDGTIIPISAGSPVAGGVYVLDGELYDDTEGRDARIATLATAKALPGAHNWQNAAAAYAVARGVGIGPEIIAAALLNFPGLPHRQELVGTVDGIDYVNDSKATNAEATAKALACYRAIYWIAGGEPKEGGIASLAPLFGRISHAFLIGEAAASFARSLDGKVAYTIAGDLETALDGARRLAASEARAGAVVLLSPAAASFDQFANFGARGDSFRRLVLAYSGEPEGGERRQ